MPFLHRLDAAERAARRIAGLRRRHPARFVFGRQQIEVMADLVIQTFVRTHD
jgi:hypothetical protein